jgi:hypothetical protein
MTVLLLCLWIFDAQVIDVAIAEYEAIPTIQCLPLVTSRLVF